MLMSDRQQDAIWPGQRSRSRSRRCESSGNSKSLISCLSMHVIKRL